MWLTKCAIAASLIGIMALVCMNMPNNTAANHQGEGGTHEPYLRRMRVWLDALRDGRPVPPPQS